METGTIKFYNRFKSYGFVTSDNGEDYFFGSEDFTDTVKTGDRVMFDLVQGKKGPKATTIIKLDE